MLLELIQNRKSVREYQDKKIPHSDLKKILEAGYLAPSWMNSQPWKFILVENQQTKDLLCELSSNQPHVKNAAALVVCIADKNGWSKEEFGEVLAARGIGESGREKIFNIPMFYPVLLGDDKVLMRSVEQVTYAVSYMMLEAKELGIDSCIIGALQNEATVIKNPELVQKVNEKLNLTKDDVIITIMTLGYALEETPTQKQRKDFNKVVHYETVGQKLDF
ncbi:MAG: nitroreductase family protein [Candidatus Gastranaerophilales bacterium]|nr:nitroreductase family protein [Candidatus Gastranaerophilales bacterium]